MFWFLVSISVIIWFILSHFPLSLSHLLEFPSLFTIVICTNEPGRSYVEKNCMFRIFSSHRLPCTCQFRIRVFVLLSSVELSSLDPCNWEFIMIDMVMEVVPRRRVLTFLFQNMNCIVFSTRQRKWYFHSNHIAACFRRVTPKSADTMLCSQEW